VEKGSWVGGWATLWVPMTGSDRRRVWEGQLCGYRWRSPTANGPPVERARDRGWKGNEIEGGCPKGHTLTRKGGRLDMECVVTS
jgi:hypothetical protein